jgi:hypothetical protein
MEEVNHQREKAARITIVAIIDTWDLFWRILMWWLDVQRFECSRAT